MPRKPRIHYTETDKALMWDRWQKGDSMHAIARLFDRGHASVQRILSETGGIRPPSRSRSRLSLTLAEREEISRGLVAGHSVRSIAASNLQTLLALVAFTRVMVVCMARASPEEVSRVLPLELPIWIEKENCYRASHSTRVVAENLRSQLMKEEQQCLQNGTWISKSPIL
jgi:hypothetical protein